MNRKEKEQNVADLKEKFSSAKSVIFTNYKGLTVEEVSQLRKQLRESEIEYRVIKNTLAKIASEGTSLEIARDEFSGPLGLAIGYDDPLIASKRLLDFAKGNEKLQVLSGLIEGQFFPHDNLKLIAKLPPRDTLFSMFAGALSQPLQRMALNLHATVSRFVHALHALKEKKSRE